MKYALIMLFSAMDHLFTYWHLKHGAQELNPIMKSIMSQPPEVSFIIKISWTASLLFLIYLLSKKSPRLTQKGIGFLVIAYGLVITYHLLGFLTY